MKKRMIALLLVAPLLAGTFSTTEAMGLIKAVKLKNLLAVKIAIKAGQNVNSKDVHENSALHHAIIKGSLSIVKYLVEKGADVNAKQTMNKTPLYFASAMSDYTIVRHLVNHGAEVNVRAKDGKTALGVAKTHASKKLLKQHGAKL